MISLLRSLRSWMDRTDRTLELAVQIMKRQQEEIRELQRHNVALERSIVDTQTTLAWLTHRLGQRGVLTVDDLPVDPVGAIH